MYQRHNKHAIEPTEMERSCPSQILQKSHWHLGPPICRVSLGPVKAGAPCGKRRKFPMEGNAKNVDGEVRQNTNINEQGRRKEKRNWQAKMGDSINCTSLSISFRKSTVTSRSALIKGQGQQANVKVGMQKQAAKENNLNWGNESQNATPLLPKWRYFF